MKNLTSRLKGAPTAEATQGLGHQESQKGQESGGEKCSKGGWPPQGAVGDLLIASS
jgi:hypothetical protein